MSKNEKGFSFLESMLSFSMFMLVVLFLIPIMFRMIWNLEESKKRVTAYRILFEHVEQSDDSGLLYMNERIVREVVYYVSYDRAEGAVPIACVEYEEKRLCVE